MQTVIKDERTKETRQTNTWLVIGTDKFLSGWGVAEGGASYAAWACRPEDRSRVLSWVKGRSDMLRVREALADGYRPGRRCAHLHIYVVNNTHPSLQS